MSTYVIDKIHSEVAFTVRHLVTRVRGRFVEFEGTIRFDQARPDQSSVNFTVQTASVDTNVADRDAHLRSQDFFHAEQFPTITFVSTRVTSNGANEFAVTGPLTIRGVVKDVTLPVTYLGTQRDPWGNDKAGFETEITLNRKEFGLTWNAALEAGGFMVGDEVKVSLTIQAAAQAA